MKINLIDFILGKFKSLKNDIKLLEKNKANNIDLELLRGYNISSYEFLIVEGYPLKLATYKENVEDGANSNKRYINIDKDISKVTVNTDIVISFIYEENGEKKIYQKFEKYSTDKFIDTVQLPFIEGNPSIQISLYKNKQYNENFEQVDSNKCSILLNYGKKEADIIDEIDEVCFRISIRDRNVLTKDNTQEYIPTADYHPTTKKYVDDKVTVKILPVDYDKNCATNVADLEPHSIYMSPNDAKFLYLGYEKLGGSFSGFFLSGNPHGKFIYTGTKDDTKIEVILEGICYTAYFKTDTVDAHTEKSVFYLTKNNNKEFTPTTDYEPATKKYVDDNKEYINYNDKLINNKITTLHISRNPVSCSTEINKKPLCELFPELLNMTYDTVFKKSISFKVNMDNFVKEYPTVKSAYNKIGINLYDENGNYIGNSYGSYINGDGLNIVYINTTQSIRFSAYFDKALAEGSNTSMETKNGYMTIQLSIPKGDNKKEFIDKIKDLKLSIIVFKTDFLNLNNESIYTPTSDYNPATKKYVDDKVASSPQLSFNENGELVVTINGVSKTFVPKG